MTKLTEHQNQHVFYTTLRWMIYSFLYSGIGIWQIAEGLEHWNEWVCWIMVIVIGFIYAYISTPNWYDIRWEELESQNVDSRPLLFFSMKGTEFFISLALFIATLFLGNWFFIGMTFVLNVLLFNSLRADHLKNKETFDKLNKNLQKKSDKDGV